MEKYDEVKTQRELARERAAQEDIFAGLGRMLYAMHMGAAGEHVTTEDGEKTPQRIDMLAEKLNAEKEGPICPHCGHGCSAADVFCPACGTKLPRKE